MSDRVNHPSRRRPTAVRALATILAMALTFAALAPSFAWAEAESEGEGSAAPGVGLPGLEEGASFEPGGEETSLEEVPALQGEEEAEPPVGSETEPEPAPVSEAAAPPAVVEPGSPAAAEPAPPIAEAPAPAPVTGPVYGTSEEADPSYETVTPTAPPEPVRNEAIVAPWSSSSSPGKTPAPVRSAPRTTSTPQAAPAPAPTGTPEPVAPSWAPVGVPVDSAGGLKGRPFHTVASGECLWSIAEGVLPVGASDAEIAAEVSRLWHLNAARIGTGDPSLILVGTVLRLH
jgi:hypothetical protein